MKRILYLCVIIIFYLFCLKSCLRADIPEEETQKQTGNMQENVIEFPKNPQNVVLNGVDYLQSQAPIGKFGGEIIMSTIGEGPKTFNPFTAKDATSSQMAGLMFDGLFSSDPQTGDLVPKLAKSYEVDESGLNFTVHLRKGLKWSDGKSVAADDVVFTWNDIIFAGFGNTSIRDSVVIDGKLPKVIKIDDYTVKFIISKPFAPFLRLISTEIAPKHIFEPAVKRGVKYFDSFYGTGTKPSEFVTSGPFRLKEYLAAQRVVFIKNPDYYVINTENQKLPYLDRVVYLIVGDLNNEILKFEAGEIDVISLQGSNVARYKQAERGSDYKVYNIGPNTGTMFIVMNLNKRKNPEGNYYVTPEKQYWFNDLNFRTAIDYALDRKNMVQNVANSLAAPLFTAESLNSIFLNENIKGHDQDISKAKQALKNSGFYIGKNQKLFDRFHNRVEFDLYTNAGNTEREALGVMVKQDLENLGMRVNFKPIEFNSLVNKMTTTLDWDMIIMGLTGSPLEPHGGKNVWDSNGSLHLFNQRLATEKFDDRLEFEKQLDEVFEKGALELDFAKRKAIYDKYQQIVYDQKPVIYIYSPIRIFAIRERIKNIFPSQLSGMTYNIEEIYTEGK